jgi:hypothetical protein
MKRKTKRVKKKNVHSEIDYSKTLRSS